MPNVSVASARLIVHKRISSLSDRGGGDGRIVVPPVVIGRVDPAKFGTLGVRLLIGSRSVDVFDGAN